MAALPQLVLRTRLGEHVFDFAGEPAAGLPDVVGTLAPRILVRWGSAEMTPRDVLALTVGVLLLLRGISR